MDASPQTYLDSELELSSLDSARFSWIGGDYRGRPSFGPELAERLFALESEPDAYGCELYEAVFPPSSELREGLREATLTAKREMRRLRFRLHLAAGLPEWIHALYWELLADPNRHLALARSPDTAFSRYLEVRHEQGAPVHERPRLLCVVAAPSDVARYSMAEIRRDEVLTSLEDSFGALADAVEVEFLEPPVTLGRLRDRLMEGGGFQLLHVFGHGRSQGGISALVLEDEDGKAHFVEEELLAEVFLGVHELRLVTLIACHGGAPSSRDPFSGLAGRLVQRGLPAVIGMRRAVRVDSALLFTHHLYRHIPRNGRADAAVNEARQQLYLAEPRGIDWSSPVLYSRLSDGRLWVPQAEPEEEQATAIAASRLRTLLQHLLLSLPVFLALGFFALNFRPASRSDMRFALHLSQMAVWLEQSAAILKHLGLLEGFAAQITAWRTDANEVKGFPLEDHGAGLLFIEQAAPPPAPPADLSVDLTASGESFDQMRFADSGHQTFILQSDDPGVLTPASESGVAEVDATPEEYLPDSIFRGHRVSNLNFIAVSPAVIGEEEEPDESDALNTEAAEWKAGGAGVYQNTERAEQLVVRITARDVEGAGIIFHIDGRHVYGITAKHVVFQRGKAIDGLKAELRSWVGSHLPVEAFNLHYQEDFAVFRAELAPAGLSSAEVSKVVRFDQLGLPDEIEPGGALYSLGHSTAGAWISSKDPLRMDRRDGPIAFLFKSDCPQGHSGGAVFDEQWLLVGMMIEEERPFCRALRIDSVLKIVQGWKLDVSLRPPPPREGDQAASRQINVAVMGFDNRSTKNLPSLGLVAQDITTSYLHTLPGVVLVTRDRLDKVHDEIKLPDMLQTGTGITNVGHLLQADALVTGSIVRYDVERRTFEGYGTSALQDVFRMAISLQILDVKSGRVQFSKSFDVERTRQYPKATSAPREPIDLTSELLNALLAQAQPEMRSALSLVVGGLGAAGQFVNVQVTSWPAGADVILNGIFMGKTPKTLEVADDIHQLQLVLSGYEPWTRRFRAEVGKDIEATLVPKYNTASSMPSRENTPTVIHPVTGAALVPPGASTLCDPSLPNDSGSPLGYHMRGDRCEGIYDQQVSAVSVEIRSLVASLESFDPSRIAELELAWTAPPGSTREVQLRAVSFKPRTYYRMDTKVPATRKIYRWPTDVLASVDLNGDDLGLVAWTRLPGSRTVYLPVRVGKGARAKDGYEVTLMPTKSLSEVRVTVARLDDQGKEVTKLRQNEELGYGYYPSDQPTVFMTGKLGPAGFYRLGITAIPKSGLSVRQDIELYHAGD